MACALRREGEMREQFAGPDRGLVRAGDQLADEQRPRTGEARQVRHGVNADERRYPVRARGRVDRVPADGARVADGRPADGECGFDEARRVLPDGFALRHLREAGRRADIYLVPALFDQLHFGHARQVDHAVEVRLLMPDQHQQIGATGNGPARVPWIVHQLHRLIHGQGSYIVKSRHTLVLFSPPASAGGGHRGGHPPTTVRRSWTRSPSDSVASSRW